MAQLKGAVDVDEPDPQGVVAVADGGAGVGEHVDDRVVGGGVVLDLAAETEVEQVPVEGGVGHVGLRDELVDVQLVLRATRVPCRPDPVDDVPARVQGEAERGEAVAVAVVVGEVELPRAPGAAEPAYARGPDPVVELLEHRQRLGAGDLADEGFADVDARVERGAVRQLQVQQVGGERTAPEAAVDRPLGGPEDRERLVDAVDQGRDQPVQHTLALVAGPHARGRQGGGRSDGPAGEGDLTGEDRAHTDQVVVLEDADRPVELDHVLHALRPPVVELGEERARQHAAQRHHVAGREDTDCERVVTHGSSF